jgi:hypothetical protein
MYKLKWNKITKALTNNTTKTTGSETRHYDNKTFQVWACTCTQKHPITISYPTNTGFWLYDFWVFIFKSFMTTWPRLHKWLSSPVPYMTPVTKWQFLQSLHSINLENFFIPFDMNILSVNKFTIATETQIEISDTWLKSKYLILD